MNFCFEDVVVFFELDYKRLVSIVFLFSFHSLHNLIILCLRNELLYSELRVPDAVTLYDDSNN